MHSPSTDPADPADPADPGNGPGAALAGLLAAVEEQVAAGGWDQPPRLYALAPTVDLLAHEPELAARLGLDLAAPAGLTPVEQDALPPGPLESALPGLAWPPEVAGAALVHETVLVPGGVEAQGPDDPGERAGWAAVHPMRRDVRLAVAVLRDGTAACRVRVRAAGTAGSRRIDEDRGGTDSDDVVLGGPALVPGLVAALLSSLT